MSALVFVGFLPVGIQFQDHLLRKLVFFLWVALHICKKKKKQLEIFVWVYFCFRLPWWTSGSVVKNLPTNYNCIFDSWVGKIPWRKKWQHIPVFLPGKSHGQRSLVGYSPWGHKRIGHNLVTKQQFLVYLFCSIYVHVFCNTTYLDYRHTIVTLL